jgi:hypothetical protein
MRKRASKENNAGEFITIRIDYIYCKKCGYSHREGDEFFKTHLKFAKGGVKVLEYGAPFGFKSLRRKPG